MGGAESSNKTMFQGKRLKRTLCIYLQRTRAMLISDVLCALSGEIARSGVFAITLHFITGKFSEVSVHFRKITFYERKISK